MKKILLIEDNADVRDMLQEALEAAGYEVRAVAEGRAGIETCGKFQPNVVVSDIYMPGMEGIETIAHLRKQRPDIKIIAISGGGFRPHEPPADYLRIAPYVGADLVLRKPFDPDHLISAVRELLA